MTTIINGSSPSLTFSDSTTQASAGLVAGGTIATGTVTTLTTTTLNGPSGVLATQNGMTGIAKAWVNFNGTGTVAIRDSFNVSSITDNGTGDYTINFTTAMPNANYSTVGSSFINVGSYGTMFQVTGSGGTATTYTTSAVRINTRSNETSTLTDTAYIFAAIFSS